MNCGHLSLKFHFFQIETFATIHNGPILMIEQNPFMSSVLLSIGEKIFAIWSVTNQLTPILWRRRETNITCAQWSSTRISLFFIACYDGNIELWDLLTRTDEACVSDDSGATIITVITQHKLSLSTDILMIGDQKANLRAFTLPSSISQPKDNDHHVCSLFIEFICFLYSIGIWSFFFMSLVQFLLKQNFKVFVDSELNRKEKFSEWQQIYAEKNQDLEEPKQLINREESQKALDTQAPETVKKEITIQDEKKRSSTGAKSK